MDANSLRRSFTSYFTERAHTLVPSSSLVPHHPTAPMFTNSGMMQFVPYFLGEEQPPWARATSAQKCVRLSGKHNDIDEVGRTRWHLTFFEMLGNWSFGDYFKEDAITMAWELLTEVIGFDADRLWVTVHVTDDEAEQIWRDAVGFPADRIQRLDSDNFWQMADTGPCGPCSEIHFDCGPSSGDGGGPAHGAGARYVEIWNLVFMQNFRHADGSLTDLPQRNVDTGLGLERCLTLLQDVPTVFDTDLLRPLVDQLAGLARTTYGVDEAADYALRSVADHARCMAFLVNDGVTPSNDGRGYVLRSVIRRAVRRAHRLGVEKPFVVNLCNTVIDLMGEAYPDLVKGGDVVRSTLEREEASFRQTLRQGSAMLEVEMESGAVSGEAAFKLHDTFGFPIELTAEMAAERGVEVDRDGFDAAMAEQRRRAKDARKVTVITAGSSDAYRALLDEHGPTEFTGYSSVESESVVLAVLPDSEGRFEVFLDRTPFYAESGGQVGDTGTITSATGTLRVVDTTYALPALIRHTCEPAEGEVTAGAAVTANVDADRRDAIRRNHTGTHMLHWALREVVGNHVQQKGSLVHPDYLRFDFSHHAPVTRHELAEVEARANARVLDNEPVRAFETTRAYAEQLGATAIFGEKYGENVRVVEAGSRSMELCGGTHVAALGFIGPIQIVSEGSIGSNLRRIFAVTGNASLDRIRLHEQVVDRAAGLLKAKPEELTDAVERLLERQRALDDELKLLRSQLARAGSAELASTAVDGAVVARQDGMDQDGLRDLALAIKDQPGIKAVVLIGSPDGERVAIVSATGSESGIDARTLIAEAKKTVGGGGGGKDPTLATAGGRDVAGIDAALDQVRAALGAA